MKNKIIINGASGKMGQVACTVLETMLQFEIVAKCGRQDDLAQAIKEHKPDVVFDVTSAECVYQNVETILSLGVRPVIGTTGLNKQQVQQLQQLAKQKQVGGIIAPNFSIGALLMMRFAKEAAKYFPRAEIIEMHHEQKKEAPSGTAVLTAEMINEQGLSEAAPTSMELLTGATGATLDKVKIHSLRLPGVLAKQQVIFSAAGETLMIEHNSINREIYAAGIRLACEKALQLDELVYGLDKIL